MNRPDRMNAVDGPMAAQLRDAFLEFESDESQKVAILWGAGGTFLCRCGFDRSLRPRPRARVASGRRRHRPDGAESVGVVQTVDRRRQWIRSGRRARAFIARGPEDLRGGFRVRSLLPALGSSSHRRRDRATAANRRAGASARHDLDRASCRCSGGAGLRTGQSCCSSGAVTPGSQGACAPVVRLSHNSACSRIAHRPTDLLIYHLPKHCAPRVVGRKSHCHRRRCARALLRSPRAPAGTADSRTTRIRTRKLNHDAHNPRSDRPWCATARTANSRRLRRSIDDVHGSGRTQQPIGAYIHRARYRAWCTGCIAGQQLSCQRACRFCVCQSRHQQGSAQLATLARTSTHECSRTPTPRTSFPVLTLPAELLNCPPGSRIGRSSGWKQVRRGSFSLLDQAQGMSSATPDVEVDPDDVILTLFTSGTTGTLKAAQHTQRSYAGICRNVLLNLLPATQDDTMLHAASLIHASGVFVLPFWLRGGKTVILPGCRPVDLLGLDNRASGYGNQSGADDDSDAPRTPLILRAQTSRV